MELSAEDLALVGRICDDIQMDEELGGVQAGGGAPVDAKRAADELRKEKNRLKVRRHYHRRLRLMNDLRRQVEVLEAQLQHLQITAERCRLLPQGALPTMNASTSEQDLQTKLEALRELERVRAQLDRENRVLRHRVATAALLPDSYSSVNSDGSNNLALAKPVRCPRSLVVVRPLLPPQVYTLRQQLMSHFLNFSRGGAVAFSKIGMMSDWDIFRGADGGEFKFIFRRRRVRGVLPSALHAASWRLLTEEQGFRSLFSSRLDFYFNVVQPIDADNALALIQYDARCGCAEDEIAQERAALPVTTKTLYLISKFSSTTDDAHTIVLRSLEPQPLVVSSLSTLADTQVKDSDKEEWTDMFSWFRFDRAGKNDTSITIGGVVPTLDARCYFWLIEMFLITMRWEETLRRRLTD